MRLPLRSVRIRQARRPEAARAVPDTGAGARLALRRPDRPAARHDRVGANTDDRERRRRRADRRDGGRARSAPDPATRTRPAAIRSYRACSATTSAPTWARCASARSSGGTCKRLADRLVADGLLAVDGEERVDAFAGDLPAWRSATSSSRVNPMRQPRSAREPWSTRSTSSASTRRPRTSRLSPGRSTVRCGRPPSTPGSGAGNCLRSGGTTTSTSTARRSASSDPTTRRRVSSSRRSQGRASTRPDHEGAAARAA